MHPFPPPGTLVVVGFDVEVVFLVVVGGLVVIVGFEVEVGLEVVGFGV